METRVREIGQKKNALSAAIGRCSDFVQISFIFFPLLIIDPRLSVLTPMRRIASQIVIHAGSFLALMKKMNWKRGPDLNQQRADYGSAALPLSYPAGKSSRRSIRLYC